MYTSVSDGKKELHHKTCGTPKSSHSSRTREREAIATTTQASPFSASLAKSLQRSSWSDCRSWQNVSVLNHSAASELEGQQLTWWSPLTNSRRSAENDRYPYISLSLTSRRRSFLLAETVSSRFFQRLTVHQNCRAWSNPSIQTWMRQRRISCNVFHFSFLWSLDLCGWHAGFWQV